MLPPPCEPLLEAERKAAADFAGLRSEYQHQHQQGCGQLDKPIFGRGNVGMNGCCTVVLKLDGWDWLSLGGMRYRAHIIGGGNMRGTCRDIMRGEI